MGESRFGHAAPSEVLVNYSSQSTAVKNVENGESPPKGLMLSDLSRIFAMSELAYIVDFASANLGEISTLSSLGNGFFIKAFRFLAGYWSAEFRLYKR